MYLMSTIELPSNGALYSLLIQIDICVKVRFLLYIIKVEIYEKMFVIICNNLGPNTQQAACSEVCILEAEQLELSHSVVDLTSCFIQY